MNEYITVNKCFSKLYTTLKTEEGMHESMYNSRKYEHLLVGNSNRTSNIQKVRLIHFSCDSKITR